MVVALLSGFGDVLCYYIVFGANGTLGAAGQLLSEVCLGWFVLATASKRAAQN